MLNLAIAGCVLNDVNREAERLGIPVEDVRVSAWGDSNRETCEIDIRSPVRVPVAVLCLRLTLGRWAKHPRQAGEWTFTPPAGG